MKKIIIVSSVMLVAGMFLVGCGKNPLSQSLENKSSSLIVGVIDGYVSIQNAFSSYGARISLSNSSLTAITNGDGYYYINNVPAGTYTVTASYDDTIWRSQSQSIVVTGGGTTRVPTMTLLQYNP